MDRTNGGDFVLSEIDSEIERLRKELSRTVITPTSH
jgi:hypothetical protein